MPFDFDTVFAALKPILENYKSQLTVKAETPTEYTVLTMQGKTCFNFKTLPDEETLGQLEQLTKACTEVWMKKGWL